MAVVAYLLVLVGGELSDEQNEAFRQTEELNELVRARGRGEEIGPWEFQFPTLDDAKEAAHQIRQTGIKFNDIQITTVDDATGRELPS
jgi:hypothetical protein